MKKIIPVILLFLSGLTINCQLPSRDLLLSVAGKFISKVFPEGSHEIIAVRPVATDSLVTMYVLDLKPEGWILMAADQRVQPVLGFSWTGNYAIPSPDPGNPHFLWMHGYDKDIKTVKSEKGTTLHQGWEGIPENQGALKSIKADIWVNTLIDVNWGQGNSWNRFCPSDTNGPGGHAYAGCVAVSMAQAMSVFKKPGTGSGTHTYSAPGYGTLYVNFGATTYNWDSMSSSLPDDYNSLLLYHCAVSVDMGFGADGSGTQTINASSALKNYFNYSRRTSYKKRLTDDQAWTDLIDQQLLSGRPVIYSGDADDGTPGHAFNIDGVVNNIYYHINWGWSGTDNGYFTINSLRPGSNDFTKNHSAIFGIQPFYYPTDVGLSDTLVIINRPAGRTVGAIKVTDEATDNVYSFSLSSDSTFNGSTWNMDYFIEGDTLKTGRTFTESDDPNDTILITVTDKFNNIIGKRIALKIGNSSTGIEKTTTQTETYFNIYPNPSSDHIYFSYNEMLEVVGIRIYSSDGTLIQVNSPGAFRDGIEISNLKPGMYILEAELENHLLIKKKFIRK